MKPLDSQVAVVDKQGRFTPDWYTWADRTGRLLLEPCTVSQLPTASISLGVRGFVTDATASTFASTVTGGGSTGVPVVSDGTNWIIG
jgi:hypothetical protein